jgi:crotonobetainyl-CoA:carnitine CoA-transferase CaiB-like acyl-CoA transferase
MTASATSAAIRRCRQHDRELRDRDQAGAYAALLLESVGFGHLEPSRSIHVHPDLDWADCGAMMLTGDADGPPLLAPAPIASSMRGAMSALVALARGLAPGGARRLAGIGGPALLGEHAAAFGLQRRGRVSAGGSCRLLHAADGWVAVNLARDDDLDLLPAWLGEATSDPWTYVEERIACRRARDVVARGRLLGLALAEAGPRFSPPPPWLRIVAHGRARARRDAKQRPPLVVDLTSLWAGPLSTHLLALAGAEVVKVESTRRPDGGRRGPAAFYDLLNAGKASVALDFTDSRDRVVLARLIERADVVVESARPRALAQLGIDAARIVERTVGKTWIAISGYGRREPGAGWVAFGDDAAAGAGLAHATGAQAGREPSFCSDAIADPLTGVHAAVAALASYRHGGGRLIDLSLHDVAAHVAGIGGLGDGRRERDAGNTRAVVERRRAGRSSRTGALDRMRCDAVRALRLGNSAPERGTPEVRRLERGVEAGPSERSNGRTPDAAWEVVLGRERHPVRAPRLRSADGTAAAFGADTRTVLHSMGIHR